MNGMSTAFVPWFNQPSIVFRCRLGPRTRALLTEHQRHPFDLVHMGDHGLGHHVRDLGRNSATVVTCHDLMAFTTPHYIDSRLAPLKKALLRRSVRVMLEASRLIAVSEATLREMVRVLGADPERISVVPNVLRQGLRPMPGARGELAARNIPRPNGPIVLSVGHLGHYKHFDLLLHAMARPELRHATLLRVGAPLGGHERDLAGSLGIGGHIVELGRVSAGTLRLAYSAASVLAIPSRDEGFGVPAIEAMACGLPVVASDGGALPEVVGDAGIVVPVANAASDDANGARALAEAIVSVLDSSANADRLRSAGLIRAESFRPEAVLPLVLDAYRNALEQHAGE